LKGTTGQEFQKDEKGFLVDTTLHFLRHFLLDDSDAL
jgi:hypothetical protein